MENFALNAIYETHKSGKTNAEWFNGKSVEKDFTLKSKEHEKVVARTHISRAESQIRMEKISRSSSMCDYEEGEACERMDYEEIEEEEDEEDDSLLAVEDLKNFLLRQQQKNNTRAERTKRKNSDNNNNNSNNANAGEGFRGSTISQLLSFHDTEERKIPLHDKELHEDMLRDQLTKEQTKEHFVLNAATAKHVLRGQREAIISYILQCCDMAKYSAITADVCMVYVDRVLSSMDIPKSTLSLIAMCCLHIAVKYEEIEDVVLSTSALRNMFAPQYCQDTVLRMESAILNELDWKLGCVTTSHFIESILKICDGATHKFERIEKATEEEEGEDWTIDYVDRLQSMSFEMYKGILADPTIRGAVLPSVLATACIGAARAKLGLFPAVTREMEVASNVSESNLSEIHGWLIEHCLNIYVARNDPECVSDYDDKYNTIGVPVPMRQGSNNNENEKVKELVDEFGRYVDVYSPTGVLEAGSLSSFRDDDDVTA